MGRATLPIYSFPYGKKEMSPYVLTPGAHLYACLKHCMFCRKLLAERFGFF